MNKIKVFIDYPIIVARKGLGIVLEFAYLLKNMINTNSEYISKDIEYILAQYSTYCTELESNKIIIPEKIIKTFDCYKNFEKFLNVKSRYFECLISLAPQAFKEDLSRKLYLDFYDFAKKLRNDLSLVPNDDFFKDRINEWKIIFNANQVPYLTKEVLFKKFNNYDVSSEIGLFQSLKDITPEYFLRKMQIPTLFDFKRLFAVLSLFQRKSKLNILDYGCGSADLSIYLAKKGHNITICDVKGGNLEAAKIRFDLRRLSINYIEATDTKPIPEINCNYDLIIAIELLEHIREPINLLGLFNKILNKNGILMLGSFPFEETKIAGDHLREAILRKKELQKLIEQSWQILNIENIGKSFKKI